MHAKDLTVGFTIDRYTRWRLLEGLDDIALSLRHAQEIDAFEAHRPSWLPTTTVGYPGACGQPGAPWGAPFPVQQ